MAVVIETHAFLGDCICSEPSIRALVKKHAGERVKVRSPFEEFLKYLPYPIEFTKGKEPPNYVLINPQGGNANLVDAVAEKYGLELDSRIPDLNIPRSEPTNKEYYLICTEASTNERHWPVAKWEELVAKLPYPCIQVGKWAKNPVPNADATFLGKKLPPEDLASLIRNSKAFITVDTGLSHFSAAVGKPYVVLMDLVYVEWRKHEGLTHAIYKGGILNITVQDVLTELDSCSKNPLCQNSLSSSHFSSVLPPSERR